MTTICLTNKKKKWQPGSCEVVGWGWPGSQNHPSVHWFSVKVTHQEWTLSAWKEKLLGSTVGRWEGHWACCQGNKHYLPQSICHRWELCWALCMHTNVNELFRTVPVQQLLNSCSYWTLGMWVVWIEMCCKYKMYTGFLKTWYETNAKYLNNFSYGIYVEMIMYWVK